jgi:hypothetical protein
VVFLQKLNNPPVDRLPRANAAGQTVGKPWTARASRPPLAHRLPPLSTGKSHQPPVLAKNRKIKNRQFFRLSLGHGGDKAPAGGQEKALLSD